MAAGAWSIHKPSTLARRLDAVLAWCPYDHVRKALSGRQRTRDLQSSSQPTMHSRAGALTSALPDVRVGSVFPVPPTRDRRGTGVTERTRSRRLIAVDEHNVTFKVKNYKIEGPGRYTTMALAVDEFIRRFLIHVLPTGFHRIRHYGLFASGNRAKTIAKARELLGLVAPAAEEAVEIDPTATQVLASPCPCCGGRMIVIETFEAGCQPRHCPTAPLVAIRIDTS